MEEPPAKRPRRTDSAAMWDKFDSSNRGAASPRSPRPHTPDKDSKSRHHNDTRGGEHAIRREDDKRRRSRSPHGRHERTRRSRSRSPRERSYRERDRDRDRNKPRDEGGRRERDRSRSADRHRSSKVDHRSDRKRDRSRSPYRNGESTTPSRQRSPPRSRIKSEDTKRATKDIKPATNGTAGEGMDVDDDDLDSMMSKVMGFSNFKTTQNTKVPGNQIYGVRKEKKTEYRQYMNRVGGFNRPLSPG